jgi:hypothetical protein
MISVVYLMQRLSDQHIGNLRRERCLSCRLPVQLGSL